MTPFGPQTIGIIMDGNRRWAKERGLPTLEGHRVGLSKLKEVVKWAREVGVGTMYFYAFSTENWNRAPEEVSYLMDLFAKAIKNELREIKEEGARVRFVGELSRLAKPLREAALALEAETKDNKNGTVVMCLSYGGRLEITEAVNKLLKEGKTNVTEEELRKAMWSGDLPDPDLIIRTSGEARLSNFLLYQAAYSELFFTETKWPDFSREEFNSILENFANRERRHGK